MVWHFTDEFDFLKQLSFSHLQLIAFLSHLFPFFFVFYENYIFYAIMPFICSFFELQGQLRIVQCLQRFEYPLVVDTHLLMMYTWHLNPLAMPPFIL